MKKQYKSENSFQIWKCHIQNSPSVSEKPKKLSFHILKLLSSMIIMHHVANKRGDNSGAVVTSFLRIYPVTSPGSEGRQIPGVSGV